MECGVTKLISARTLEALPDGMYHTNNISPMYFVKKDGVLEFKNGSTATFERFVASYKSIVGPFLEVPDSERSDIELAALERLPAERAERKRINEERLAQYRLHQQRMAKGKQ